MSEASPSAIPILHVHAQAHWHEPATIVGNRPALEALAQAIRRALHGNPSRVDAFVADGEGFECHVRLRDAPVGAEAWSNARMPYTDEIAADSRELEP